MENQIGIDDIDFYFAYMEPWTRNMFAAVISAAASRSACGTINRLVFKEGLKKDPAEVVEVFRTAAETLKNDRRTVQHFFFLSTFDLSG